MKFIGSNTTFNRQNWFIEGHSWSGGKALSDSMTLCVLYERVIVQHIVSASFRRCRDCRVRSRCTFIGGRAAFPLVSPCRRLAVNARTPVRCVLSLTSSGADEPRRKRRTPRTPAVYLRLRYARVSCVHPTVRIMMCTIITRR